MIKYYTITIIILIIIIIIMVNRKNHLTYKKIKRIKLKIINKPIKIAQ
jgi:hypothetical protein